MDNWQKVQLEAEQFKKKTLAERLENIRQNITPQFVHTNFDQLKELIQESPDLVDNYLRTVSSQQATLQATLDTELAGLQEALDTKEEVSVQSLRQKTDSSPILPQYKTRFLVRSGSRMNVVNSDHIAGFYKDDIVLLITVEGRKYAIDNSLDELVSKLDPLNFFRINRQCIINAQAVQEIRMQGSQLLLQLSVDFPKTLTVSQRNVAKFKRWLDQE